MISDHYVWFAWSILFLVLWGVIFTVFPDERRKIWKTSLFTMLFGLTEPLFVPRYWNPPSIFDLAQKTKNFTTNRLLVFLIWLLPLLIFIILGENGFGISPFFVGLILLLLFFAAGAVMGGGSSEEEEEEEEKKKNQFRTRGSVRLPATCNLSSR